MSTLLSTDEQFACLNILDYLTDLFTAAGKEEFTRTDVLVIIDAVRSDPDFFDPDCVIAQQIATASIPGEERLS